mmetsp:Transcript_17755/g.31943  ORF Transcript_17755/g.31943 Transcript_17755/m.31943 type:complete len:255 (-) Transcript_17755:28-792(-)
MLSVHWIATVMLCTMIVDSATWAAFLAFMNTLCFWSINYVACELEMPFGDDPDDLPMHHLQADMNASLTGLLHPLALRAPSFELPVAKDGTVNLQSGTMQLCCDGKIDFRVGGHSVKEMKGAFDCFRPCGWKSLSEHRHGGHRHAGFHVPRILRGKRGNFPRGPSQEASLRRETGSRVTLRDVENVSFAASCSHVGTSNVDGCESAVLQEELVKGQSSLEYSRSLDRCENGESTARQGTPPAATSVIPELHYAI